MIFYFAANKKDSQFIKKLQMVSSSLPVPSNNYADRYSVWCFT